MTVFTLLNLPDKALNIVLNNLEFDSQLGFSILSERTKALIKSMKIQIYGVELRIDHAQTSIYVYDTPETSGHWSFRTTVGKQSKTNHGDEFCELLYCIPISYRRIRGVSWEKAEFRMRDWTQHFLEVTNRQQFDELKIDGSSPNPIALYENAGDAKTIILTTFTYKNSQRSFAALFHPEVLVYSGSFNAEDTEICHELLMQNFEQLALSSVELYGGPARMELDSLLLINSCSIRLNGFIVTSKTLNRFLKHWIAASNPNMKYMRVNLKKVLSESEVLKGIPCFHAPDDREKEFKKYFSDEDVPATVTVIGGVDVRRHDGTKATIEFNNENRFQSVLIHVWED